jgi:DNA invertase Pin-like site-specific DNA recombinase
MNKLPDTKIPVLLFARVSSEDQCYDYQISELKEYCDSKNFEITEIISNNYSGKVGKKRPDLIQLFEMAKKGTFRKVVITSMERLGRDSKMIRRTIDFLHERKIAVVFKNQGFESLDENGEETFITNVLISIYSELCQEDNKQRGIKIRSGLALAKKKGKIIGRQKGWKKDNDKLLKEYSKLARDIKNNLSLNQCIKLHGVSKNTVIKVKRALAM